MLLWCNIVAVNVAVVFLFSLKFPLKRNPKSSRLSRLLVFICFVSLLQSYYNLKL